jgi:hypothetical protein
MNECGVCYDCLDYKVDIPCGHIFCYDCLTKWRLQCKKDEKLHVPCPICRQSLSYFYDSTIDTEILIVCLIISTLVFFILIMHDLGFLGCTCGIGIISGIVMYNVEF